MSDDVVGEPKTQEPAEPLDDPAHPGADGAPSTGWFGLPPSFGTAIGAAALGFEQAIRAQPPPEVQAMEHRPIRGLSAQDEEVLVVFPDEPAVDTDADDP